MDGDVRAKDGVELSITYVTSINPVRQKTQAIIKQALEEIGFRVELQQVDAGIFFDSSAGQRAEHQPLLQRHRDVHQQRRPRRPDRLHARLVRRAGRREHRPDSRTIGPARTTAATSNAEYDALFEQVRLETDLERAAELFIQMNDILINDVAVIPLVNRAASKYGDLDDAARGERRLERRSSTTTGTSPTGTGRPSRPVS